MATDAHFDQARELFLSGVQHYEAARWAEAERDFAAALSLVPGRPSTLLNLAAARLKLGRAGDALALLDELLQQEPDKVDALGLRATALAELARYPEALLAFDRVLAVDPASGQAWSMRGSVLHELERHDEAAQSYERALACGCDDALNLYYLGALSRAEAPPTAPRHYVEQLFDGYAFEFDAELVERLRYQAPQVLVEGLDAARQFERAVDLGCGTGLCGRLLRPRVARLEGVDLSSRMLAQARQAAVYDRLEQTDIGEFLAAGSETYDLAISADVFIYVGELDHVFAQLTRRMTPGGVFCFSVEEVDDSHTLVLRRSRRYAHSERYIRELAARHGFAVQALRRAPVREEKRVPIPGLYFWLVRE